MSLSLNAVRRHSRDSARSIRTVLLASLACTAATAAACGGADGARSSADAPVRTDSAGVRRLALSSADRAYPDSLVEVLRISPTDSGPGSFGGVASGSVATNGSDRIYVLARDEAQVVAFDTTGAPLARWGRRGAGPGETEYPSGLLVGGDGVVELFDVIRTANVRYAPDGAVLSPRALPRDSLGVPTGQGIVADGAFAFIRRRAEGDSSTRELLLARERDTTVLAALTVPVTADVAFESCPIRLRAMEPYFSPVFTAASAPAGLAVLRGASWRVEWYADGRLASVWTRETTPVASTEALLEAELERGFELRFNGQSCKVPTEEVGRSVGVAPVLPALRRIAVAPDGTLWAERFEPRAAPPRVDLVSPEGRYLGTITGRGAPLAFLAGGRVLYAEEDEDTGLTDVVVYALPGAGW